MFLIFGIDQARKQLNSDRNVVCPVCGAFGHLNLWVEYTYFMLFFIPIFKWNRHYFARLSCCGAVCELDTEQGRDIERKRKNLDSIDISSLNFTRPGFQSGVWSCPDCGFESDDNFSFCPKCGRKF
ncbi:MAG: zinc ribbon domain-containing protein [Oscillospiraceae bacterium]|nr:zinc ribbon domain-containing protein [Oscillospiraceae bacterium]